jgi:glycopeptide antibiotics resistance protein
MLPGGFARWLPVIAISIATLPAAFVVIRALDTRSRRNGVPPDLARRRSISEVGMVAGTLPWIWMTLTPLPRPRSVRLIPLRDLADQLAGAPVTAFFQVGGNLLLLTAFGFFAATRWRIGVATIAAMAATTSLTVEILQYALALGRVSSVDDVLLNTVGAALAALASRRYWRPAELTPAITPSRSSVDLG